MVNKNPRDVIVTRARVIKYIRNFLESRELMEVDFLILEANIGEATARPFVTWHNDMKQDLVMTVAPELYLKQMVVG